MILFARMNAECAPEQELDICHSWRVRRFILKIYFGNTRTSPFERGGVGRRALLPPQPPTHVLHSITPSVRPEESGRKVGAEPMPDGDECPMVGKIPPSL